MTIKKTGTVLATVLLVFLFSLFAFAETEGEATPQYVQAPNQSMCFVRGDADGNGEVKASDARLILRAAVGLEFIYGDKLARVDINGNGKCDSVDARAVLRISVELDNPAPHVSAETIMLTPSTCFESGTCAELCKFCNMLFDNGKLPPSEHLALEWEVLEEATCLSDGYSRQKCLACNSIVDERVLPPINHDYGETQYAEPPNCFWPVNTFRECSRCGDVQYETEMPRNKHSWFPQVITPPTCTEDGLAKIVCLHCHEEKEEPEVLPCFGSHAPDHQWQTTIYATCETPGEKVKACVVCLEILETEEIPALGHKIKTGSYEKISEPTCTEHGEEKLFCTRCGIDIIQKIPPKGHNPSGEPVKVLPTCTQNGTSTYKCSDCEQDVVLVISATGHSEKLKWEYDEAANEQRGYCEICGELITTIPKI